MQKHYLAALALVCAMTLLCTMTLTACGEEDSKPSTTNEAAETTEEGAEKTEAEEEAAAPAELLPGILADFTKEASMPVQDEYNEDGNFDYMYAYCMYDWNDDGTDEVFNLRTASASDGLTLIDGSITAFVGSSNDPSSTNGRYSTEYIEDVAEITLVGWIDIVPDDGNKELVVSAKKNDGTEQTFLANSSYSHIGEDYEWTNLYDGAFRSWENGILTIGDTEYGIPEGKSLFKPVEELAEQ
jgi:hypothetical protein